MSDPPARGGDSGGSAFDPRDFRNALGTFPTGVAIVTTVAPDGTPIGLTCNSFSSVSLSPALVLWSLSLRSPNLNRFLQAPNFAINVLAADQRSVSHRFAQPIANKFEGVRYTQGKLGVPLIFDAAAIWSAATKRATTAETTSSSSDTCCTIPIANARRSFSTVADTRRSKPTKGISRSHRARKMRPRTAAPSGCSTHGWCRAEPPYRPR